MTDTADMHQQTEKSYDTKSTDCLL